MSTGTFLIEIVMVRPAMAPLGIRSGSTAVSLRSALTQPSATMAPTPSPAGLKAAARQALFLKPEAWTLQPVFVRDCVVPAHDGSRTRGHSPVMRGSPVLARELR